MNRPNLRVALLCVAIAASTVAMPAFAQTLPTPTAAIQRASCVVRLEWSDGRYGQPNPLTATLAALFASTAIVDPALEAALSTPATAARAFTQVDVQPAGESAVTVTVLVRPGVTVTVPGDAARRVLKEVTRRAERSFNGAATQPDDREGALAPLLKQRADLDAKLTALRVEFNTLSANAPTFYPSGRVDLRPSLKQQLDDMRTDLAVQDATVTAVEEQLHDLPGDAATTQPDLAALRVKLIGQRADARIAIAKDKARVDDLRRRLAAIEEPATRPERTAAIVQNEMNDMQQQRQQVDQQINELRSRRQNAPAKPRLVVMDGGDE